MSNPTLTFLFPLLRLLPLIIQYFFLTLSSPPFYHPRRHRCRRRRRRLRLWLLSKVLEVHKEKKSPLPFPSFHKGSDCCFDIRRENGRKDGLEFVSSCTMECVRAEEGAT